MHPFMTHSFTLLQIRSLVKASRSSPQQTKSFLCELVIALRPPPSPSSSKTPTQEHPVKRIKRLILDVATRWSLTHQMLGLWFFLFSPSECSADRIIERALLYCAGIDCYVRVNDNLCHLTLAAEDWAAIEIVAEWLQLFRTATTLMSPSKDTTILWVHICFTCLQDHI
jgi:hypothetical protein